jgi:hypothetical protein
MGPAEWPWTRGWVEGGQALHSKFQGQARVRAAHAQRGQGLGREWRAGWRAAATGRRGRRPARSIRLQFALQPAGRPAASGGRGRGWERVVCRRLGWGVMGGFNVLGAVKGLKGRAWDSACQFVLQAGRATPPGTALGAGAARAAQQAEGIWGEPEHFRVRGGARERGGPRAAPAAPAAGLRGTPRRGGMAPPPPAPLETRPPSRPSLHLERPRRDAQHAAADDDARLEPLELVDGGEGEDAEAEGGRREGAVLRGGARAGGGRGRRGLRAGRGAGRAGKLVPAPASPRAAPPPAATGAARPSSHKTPTNAAAAAAPPSRRA